MRILHCGTSLRVALFAFCLTTVDPIAAHASSAITGISLSYKQDVLGLDVGAPPSTAAL